MKSKDPEFRIPVDKESFRCFKCDYVVLKTTGGLNEVEPGLAAMMCNDCYKPKKDPRKDVEDVASETSDSDAPRSEDEKGQGSGAGQPCVERDTGASSVPGEEPVG